MLPFSNSTTSKLIRIGSKNVVASRHSVRYLYKEWQSSLDDPPPSPETGARGLLDEEPGAEQAFVRVMAQAMNIADAKSPSHKGRRQLRG
jgi:hypothetical protein